MIRVALAGAAGRMGRVIGGIILKDMKDLEISGALEVTGSPFLGSDVGTLLIGEINGVSVSDDPGRFLSGASVMIDFTSSEGSLEHIALASELGVPSVVGSTGYTEEQEKMVEGFAKRIPLVLAPNMSIGVNLLFRLVKDVTEILGSEYDVEISEIHHRFKKDAPSGTAVRLGQIIAEEKGSSLKEMGVFGREGVTGERGEGEIGIMSMRAGDVVGEHTVTFGGIGERIELTHRAHTRETFGRGAIRAARWVLGRQPGLYNMQDVLGI